jgi:hypothetical protein
MRSDVSEEPVAFNCKIFEKVVRVEYPVTKGRKENCSC